MSKTADLGTVVEGLSVIVLKSDRLVCRMNNLGFFESMCKTGLNCA